MVEVGLNLEDLGFMVYGFYRFFMLFFYYDFRNCFKKFFLFKRIKKLREKFFYRIIIKSLY